jgi:4-hydroxyphenylpyruvate dioxygenase
VYKPICRHIHGIKKNAPAATRFVAYMTNPENSAKLAQFFPSARKSLLNADVLKKTNALLSSAQLDKVVVSGIHTYGDVTHTFVQREGYKGVFLPGYAAAKSRIKAQSTGLLFIDHVVGNQPDSEMENVVRFYENIFGFQRLWTVDDKDISTEHTALRSIVVADENETIKMPINEPAQGLKKSQIQEYVDFNSGAGVQHIAMSTNDIVMTIKKLVENGAEFLYVPKTYYEDLSQRVGVIEEDIKILESMGILVDRDDSGYLLQLFTKPVQDRPTLFFELIQRKNARSFGKGNFKALFESIEREQARRGTL